MARPNEEGLMAGKVKRVHKKRTSQALRKAGASGVRGKRTGALGSRGKASIEDVEFRRRLRKVDAAWRRVDRGFERMDKVLGRMCQIIERMKAELR